MERVILSKKGSKFLNFLPPHFASAIDGTSELEPLGLVSSRPALRPADVLTGVPDPSGRLAALDVGIIAPQAHGAGEDCVETMVARR